MDKMSKMGYKNSSPYRNRKFIDIHSPNGTISMDDVDIPLYAEDETGYSKVLMPNSGMHQFPGKHIRENPYAKGGNYKQELYKYLFDDEEYEDMPTAPSSDEIEQPEQQEEEEDDGGGWPGRRISQGDKDRLSGKNPYSAKAQADMSAHISSGGQWGKIAEGVRFFLDKGYDLKDAAAFIANGWYESNLRTDVTGDGGKAQGSFQWHPTRYIPLSRMFDLKTPKGNYEALHYELNTSETKARNAMRLGKTAREKAIIFDIGLPGKKGKQYGFERSQGLSTTKRGELAEEIFNRFNK